MSARRAFVCIGLAMAVLAAACTSGDDADTSTADEDAVEESEVTDETDGQEVGEPATTEDESEQPEPEVTGPAPGVTDETVKIGVTFVDVEALRASGLEYDLGEHRAVYEALAADINANGGIHGRMVEFVIKPVNAAEMLSDDRVCVEITEDEDVFLVTGFFLADSVTCFIGTHATATVGGGQTPDRSAIAEAPWITWNPDTDQPKAVTETFAEMGELDGPFALFGHVNDQEQIDLVSETLDELGLDPVETGIVSAPSTDNVAVQNDVRTIAQAFEAAGAKTVLLVGNNAANWPNTLADDASYRPQLLFLDITGARAFSTNEVTTDTTILEGGLFGGGYGPDQARYEEAEMQACIDILAAAGLETPPPEDFTENPSIQPYQAAFQACPDIALVRAWLEAAGENLNYGTLAAALDEGFEVVVPGDPGLRTYGPPPAGDGDPVVYIYSWDEAAGGFVLDEA